MKGYPGFQKLGDSLKTQGKSVQGYGVTIKSCNGNCSSKMVIIIFFLISKDGNHYDMNDGMQLQDTDIFVRKISHRIDAVARDLSRYVQRVKQDVRSHQAYLETTRFVTKAVDLTSPRV